MAKKKGIPLPLGKPPWERKKEGQEFIKEREKRTAEILQDPSRSVLGAERQARQEMAGLEVIKKEQQMLETEKVEQELREKEASEFLEEKGIFEEKLPERTELGSEGTGGFVEKLPVFGPSAVALADIAAETLTGALGISSIIKRETLIQNPETLREVALQKIQQEVIDEGTTAREKFGALIESIPVVGPKVTQFAGELIEDPKSNVEKIVTEIQSERERASVLAEKAMTGKLGQPFLAVEQIEDIEENIIRLEQRIKLLSMESAELRANADEINRIEEVILRSKERVFIAKQAAAAGIVAPATDSNIFLTLEDLKISERG